MTKARDMAKSGYSIGPISSRPTDPELGTQYYDTTVGQMLNFTDNGNWVAIGTAAPSLPVVTGGTLTSDSTYYYRTFTGTANLVVTKATLNADILCVAGGGGGGFQRGGGGGAGGVLYLSGQSLPINTYTATVGAGGASDVSGNNSQLGSLTAAVGGGRGGNGTQATNSWNASNGGSGGGGGVIFSGSTRPTAGTGVSGQGYAGGLGTYPSDPTSGGGGGGASAAGANSTLFSSTGTGTGGAGTNSYSSWLSVVGLGVSGFIAGGGGGGAWVASDAAGGSGGGGGGKSNTPSNGPFTGTSATATTGSGGGGGSNGAAGGSGAGGFIIVRYTKASVGG